MSGRASRYKYRTGSLTGNFALPVSDKGLRELRNELRTPGALNGH